MAYLPRVIDGVLDDLLPHLPAIAIEGARGVGKTATAQRRAERVIDLTQGEQRAIIEAKPDLAVSGPGTTLIDEWQLVPEVWDRVRAAVDVDPTGGRFLLTGSAWPSRQVRIHSGAGRIARLTLRPLSFPERGLARPTVSLTQLLAGDARAIEGESGIDLTAYTEEITASGFPGLRNLPERPRRVQLDSYLDRAVDRDLPENGTQVRRPSALRAWLAAYGGATSTTSSYTTILEAATSGSANKASRQTLDGYREALERQFLLDPLPAWEPALSPLRRLALAPKHHLVDPALAARLAQVDAPALLRGEGRVVAPGAAPFLGALFESLVAQTVRVLAAAAFARTFHLRTKGGEHEVDLIVEADDGRVVAIEVKLNPVVTAKDVAHLLWLRRTISDRLADLVVVTTGRQAHRRPDGVAVVPLALLGV
ncbi:MAG: DUF4143 domain-containing protein [Bifidobacteriaceae bacterium]|jgi:predicted AAA+ superfamily ATPase|nr:DUF4143 domain-containing protein [Bifidobacteriaceae bacterium]